jgi:hypothetical protein
MNNTRRTYGSIKYFYFPKMGDGTISTEMTSKLVLAPTGSPLGAGSKEEAFGIMKNYFYGKNMKPPTLSERTTLPSIDTIIYDDDITSRFPEPFWKIVLVPKLNGGKKSRRNKSRKNKSRKNKSRKNKSRKNKSRKNKSRKK